MPRAANGRESRNRRVGGSRHIMRVVCGVVILRIAGPAITGPGVVMVVAVIAVLRRPSRVVRDFGQGGVRGPVGHGVIDDRRQQQAKRCRDAECEAKRLAVEALRHDY